MPRYYELISSFEELVGEIGLLRLPKYLREEFVFDDSRVRALHEAVKTLREGRNVLIIGVAGVGKTALMAMVIDKLISLGMRVGYILEGASRIGTEHMEKGIVLFYDDIPRMQKSAIRSIMIHRVNGIIATAREEELDELKKKLGRPISDTFKVVRIEKMSDSNLGEILHRFAHREGIQILPEAAEIIIRKAENLPVYVWQTIRDLKVQGKSVLTVEFAKKIPLGMLNYVDSILWRVLDMHPDRHALLLTLLIVSDMPKYEVNVDLLNAIFAEALKEIHSREVSIAEAVLNEIYGKMLKYMAKVNPHTYKLPHDSWGDVLKGKGTGLMSAEISRINTLFPHEERLRIVQQAITRARNEVLAHAESPQRVEAFSDFIENLRPPVRIPEAKEETKRPRGVGKLILIREGRMPISTRSAKGSPLYRSIIENPVLWSMLGMSKRKIASRVRLVTKDGVYLSYPTTEAITLDHKFDSAKTNVKDMKLLTSSMLALVVVSIIIIIASALFLDSRIATGVILLHLYTAIFIAAGIYTKASRRYSLVIETLEVRGDPVVVNDFIRYIVEAIGHRVVSRITRDRLFRKALERIGLEPEKIMDMWRV